MPEWSRASSGVLSRDSKAAFGAGREELAELQAGADAPRTLSRSDARKQEEAQSFALLTALLLSAWADADARGKIVLSKGVNALGRRIGIAHAAVTLTEAGFQTTLAGTRTVRIQRAHHRRADTKR